jgi:hypothetical protein
MPPVARSVEELFPLIEFCKNGDLKAVSDWIAKGNPLDLLVGKKTRKSESTADRDRERLFNAD